MVVSVMNVVLLSYSCGLWEFDKFKSSAFSVTKSDELDNEEKAENVANYVAFGISYASEHGANKSNSLDSKWCL